MQPRRVRLVASGRVQGVFFRASARDEAERLGLAGWVRNLADGRVEAEVQGPAESVERFLDYCRSGPGHAVVDELRVDEQPPALGEAIFTIRPTPPS